MFVKLEIRKFNQQICIVKWYAITNKSYGNRSQNCLYVNFLSDFKWELVDTIIKSQEKKIWITESSNLRSLYFPLIFIYWISCKESLRVKSLGEQFT